jgi:hypothetical protein
VDYARALRRLDDGQFDRIRAASEMAVGAWVAVTRRRGSLIQDWVRGSVVDEAEHFPPNDLIDLRTGSQFFYHAHRSGLAEHGHVHLFWHATASGARRRPRHGRTAWRRTAPTHLFAIGLSDRGLPVSLFTVNQWVTEGHWFDAQRTLALLDRFCITPVRPHSDSCRWLNNFVTMYRPAVERLLADRDRRVARLTARRPWREVAADTRVEMLSTLALDWRADLDAVAAEAQRRRLAPRPGSGGSP